MRSGPRCTPPPPNRRGKLDDYASRPLRRPHFFDEDNRSRTSAQLFGSREPRVRLLLRELALQCESSHLVKRYPLFVDTSLSVNLNKVALLRNQRDVGYPSVVEMARLVIDAGADGITVHPRPDERHIRRADALELGAMIRAEYAGRIEYNIEGYPSDDFLDLVAGIRPDQVTLVPDDPDQRTSDHGWDLARDGARLSPVVERLKTAGIRVSLFVDPAPAQMPRARDAGADRIELYTEPYARAHACGDFSATLAKYVDAARRAASCEVGINAGHDLNLDNLPDFRRAISDLAEVSIGHAITADALRVGFPDAVRAYLRALGRRP